MLLAAGLSTRVRPLTDHIPKPLLPFWHTRLLELSLGYLETFGIQDVAVNVHHGRKNFLNELAAIPSDTKITPYVEEIILGTGGGIKNMRSFVREKTFVVLNCDFLTDVSIEDAIAFHRKKKSVATMVLIPGPNTKRYSGIGINKEGRIVQFPYGVPRGGETSSGMFSGIHIFDREIFNEMPDQEVFCINREVYAPLVEAGGPVYGFMSKSRWLDTGETALYAKTQSELLEKPLPWMRPWLKDFKKVKPAAFASKSAKIGKQVKLVGPLLIGDNVVVEDDISLGPNTIVGPYSKIGKGSRISNSILYPKSQIAPSTKLSNCILDDRGHRVGTST